jgi:hypothetical protein
MRKGAARVLNGALIGLSLALAGCLLVAPLDEFEKSAASAGKSGKAGGSGGEPGGGGAGTGEGGAPSAGSGAEAGDSSTVGEAGRGSGGEAGAPSGCRTNVECIVGGGSEPYRCRSDGECVRLKTEECRLTLGDIQDPDAIYIGSFAPLGVNPEDNDVVPAESLALTEFNRDGGLPGPDGKLHPIVMVFCDNDTEEQVLAGMDHLANDVQVPGVLAMLLPDHMQAVFEQFEEHGIFYLNPVGTTRTVADLDDDGLSWNLLGQPSDLAPVYAELVRLLELHIRAQRVLEEDLIKVALVTTTDPFNSELANYVTEELEINGAPTSENDDEHFRIFTVVLDQPLEDQLAIGDAVREYRPDLVISTAGLAYTRPQGVLQRIEMRWLETEGAEVPRPFHVLSPFNAGDMDYVIQFVSALMGLPDSTPTDELANERFVGIEAAGALDQRLQNQYADRLRGVDSNADVDTGNYYDAFYYLAYSMYAAEKLPSLTGADIRFGLGRLLTGPSYNVGPPIAEVYEALRPENSQIKLIGTLGPPDFDMNGNHIDSGAVFCIQRSDDALGKFPNALRYDRSRRRFEGDFPCFELPQP